MPFATALTKRLGLTHPIIQAPMAGGGDTPELVAAVCEAGAIGFIGAAYLTPEQIAAAAAAIRARTKRPFGINLFAPRPAASVPGDPARAIAAVAAYYAEMGLPPPAPPPAPDDGAFERQVAAASTAVPRCSASRSACRRSAVAAIRSRGMVLVGTATTVDEAQAVEALGVDAVVTQGGEAGGHRGTFAVGFERGLIGTMALVPQVVDAVKIPVIASGGIMDGRGIAAALALGASGVQMGTAFLTCDEAGIPRVYKDAILAAREDDTRLTRAFSGRHARGIVNRFMTEVEAATATRSCPSRCRTR